MPCKGQQECRPLQAVSHRAPTVHTWIEWPSARDGNLAATREFRNTPMTAQESVSA